ncbi:hypothetical protein OJ962_30595, partial [Solirubrobacter sp. CPCC 204708]
MDATQHDSPQRPVKQAASRPIAEPGLASFPTFGGSVPIGASLATMGDETRAQVTRALQRSAGNVAVTRMVTQAREHHGAARVRQVQRSPEMVPIVVGGANLGIGSYLAAGGTVAGSTALAEGTAVIATGALAEGAAVIGTTAVAGGASVGAGAAATAAVATGGAGAGGAG